jgi:hypothetical protein
MNKNSLSSIKDSCTIDPSTGCWLWNGRLTSNGYGRLNVLDDNIHREIRAHRHTYALKNGPIPNGLLALHRCDIRRCCNPDHIFLGTYKDNSEDMKAKSRSPKNRTGKILSSSSKAKLAASLRRYHASRKGAN